MKIFRIALLEGTRAETRDKASKALVNRELLSSMGLNIGDILQPVPNVSGSMIGSKEQYEIKNINEDGTVNLLAMTTGRTMPNVDLYGNDIRQNVVRRWSKV